MSALHLPAGAGAGHHFLGTTMTVKAGEPETGGALTLIEQECPPHFATPWHVHQKDDEAFYVLSGTVRLYCGDRTWEAGSGDFVLLPRDLPHAFANRQDSPLRLLQLTWPAGFEHFAADIADLTGHAPDPDLLTEVAARHGYRIIGPLEEKS
ncbi:cupin domain-containing protein [Nonomuraea wenchangensis]|uniref:Cupin domain-containing protein n=1 Tax=Nonomuraea wenchangensis TaxID=568860 RepID=A0A1I0CUM9_9ACTN|nr:cupin domain-containing protein [Nonomuraea wenchangensis]SET23522.1 Cupin domain-containing protein [Nonomuraea wenchangensis]